MFKHLRLGEPAPIKPAYYIPPIARPLVRAASEGRDVAPIVLSVARSFGFDGFLYGASLNLQPVAISRQFVYSTWPQDLFPVYDERGYIEVDPRVRDLLGSVMPLVWDQATYEGQSENVDEFLMWLQSYKICSGVTCPLRDMRGRLGAMFLSCSTNYMDESRRIMVERNMGDIHLFAHCFHELFVNGALSALLPENYDLSKFTKRERECLLLASQGMTGETIAEKLGVSLRTVQHEFDRLRDKLGASNRQEAIMRGLQYGII